MSNESNLAFPIPNSVLEPYIKTAVSTAIAAALGDGTALVEKAVHAALSIKTNEKGQVSGYSYENKHSFVEAIAADHIRTIAREVVREMAEGMRPTIKTAVEKQITKQHNIIAKTMVDGLIESLKTTWNVNVSIQPKATDR